MEFPDVGTAYQHVDAATIFLATDPGRFDVIVTDNLFGDIITDIAGAIVGGIGLAARGNINPERTYPSMFEPVHGSGSRHRRAGQGRPHGHRALGRAPARAPRPSRGRLGLSRRRGPRPRRARRRTPVDPAVGDAIAARLV